MLGRSSGGGMTDRGMAAIRSCLPRRSGEAVKEGCRKCVRRFSAPGNRAENETEFGMQSASGTSLEILPAKAGRTRQIRLIWVFHRRPDDARLEAGEAKIWLEPVVAVALNHGLAPERINMAVRLAREHHDERWSRRARRSCANSRRGTARRVRDVRHEAGERRRTARASRRGRGSPPDASDGADVMSGRREHRTRVRRAARQLTSPPPRAGT
jgi:hypothetical protein